MKIKGFQEISLLRWEIENKVEFVVITEFKNIESVKEFAGENYAKTYVPDKARKVLLEYNEKANHYDLITSINPSH